MGMAYPSGLEVEAIGEAEAVQGETHVIARSAVSDLGCGTWARGLLAPKRRLCASPTRWRPINPGKHAYPLRQERFDCCQRQVQVERVVEERRETKLPIECGGRLVDRVDLDRMDPEADRQIKGTLESIEQESLSQSFRLKKSDRRRVGRATRRATDVSAASGRREAADA